MGTLGQADDLNALLEVLTELDGVLGENRDEIETVCASADKLFGITSPVTLGTDETAVVEEERNLETVEQALESSVQHLNHVTSLLRLYSRGETIRELEVHLACADELHRWREKATTANNQLLELQALQFEIDKKLVMLLDRSR